MRVLFGLCVLALLGGGLLGAQSRAASPRARSSKSQTNISPYETPPATFEGTLRSIDKKQIIIVSAEDQEVVFERSHKTKFLKNSKAIKPDAIPAGTPVQVEATRDVFGTVKAVDVIVSPPKPKQPNS